MYNTKTHWLRVIQINCHTNFHLCSPSLFFWAPFFFFFFFFLAPLRLLIGFFVGGFSEDDKLSFWPHPHDVPPFLSNLSRCQCLHMCNSSARSPQATRSHSLLSFSINKGVCLTVLIVDRKKACHFMSLFLAHLCAFVCMSLSLQPFFKII